MQSYIVVSLVQVEINPISFNYRKIKLKDEIFLPNGIADISRRIP